MVRIIENGVFRISAASAGRLTYWLALLMVIGRTAVVIPPRIPAIVTGMYKPKQTTCTT